MSSFRPLSRGSADDPAGAERGRSGSGSAEASELRRSVALAAEQIDKIISAAEDAAAQIHADAEHEAERYLNERRRQADLVLEQQQAALTEAFADLRRQLAEIEAGALVPAPVPGREEPTLQSLPDRPVPPPTAYPGVARADNEPSQEAAGAPADHAPALIRAAQLAVSGRSRLEIEIELRDELGVEDPSEIVDEILPPD